MLLTSWRRDYTRARSH